ncbi:DNA-directed RNA polymerase III subunit RPC3 [Ceratocystis fimbriata CBS 114723]|uniref:DNA-directed RNA polymerase III subunit RPC3 n=1 Tax=Ceratocystis fimbriata CBS 114723 TaxID=1035309 RepID=A0A2C5X0K8_9PEZI|nr:DNA-directed RNA polymerase III subunit RPC3 [Ceratocystis fimbriata CBS 114723]
MVMTKHSAELCTLLVRDIYGELPSRIIAGLFNRGPSTISQLGQLTALSPRHLRHGLAVLVQQSLVYHHLSPTGNKQTIYEANPYTSYNVIRLGKIINNVGFEYGTAEQEIVQTIASLGHAQVADLAQAFSARSSAVAASRAAGAAKAGNDVDMTCFELNETKNVEANGQQDGASLAIDSPTEPESAIKGTWHLHEVIAQLIQAEILDVIVPGSMRKLHDVYDEIEQNFQRKHKDASAKARADMHLEMVKEFRDARAQTKRLKRDLDSGLIASKRRKLNFNGDSVSDESEFEGRQLASNTVVRINYEKCNVNLRNERLVRFAADVLGETTGQVFSTLLRILTKGISRCRPDPRVDSAAVAEDEFSGPQKIVTTLEILDQLDSSINVHLGIGKADKAKIDKDAAEKIRISALDTEDEADSDGEMGVTTLRPKQAPAVAVDIDSDDEPASKGAEGTATEVTGSSTKDSRTMMLRQHLLLLAEHKHRFIRHCGLQGRGQWTIDIELLMDTLRQVELDAIITRSFGRHGLRLTRILQQKGRLDEKTLASLALMKKQAVQNKILDLQQGGFVEIQEVPRDNNRMANRTMFFWFCDVEATKKSVIENLQKMILRCLERLDYERRAEKDLLEYVNRTDVKGKEEQEMSTEHFQRYSKFLSLQDKILGEVQRLDDMLALFSDY